MIECVQKGEAIAADWTGGIKEGSVVLTEINETAAAAGTAAKIEEVKKGIMDGTVNVFDTKNFTVGQAAVAADHKADVDTDDAYTPDTVVVENGVFKESKFRSAPYFDLRIDGITLLNEKF